MCPAAILLCIVILSNLITDVWMKGKVKASNLETIKENMHDPGISTDSY